MRTAALVLALVLWPASAFASSFWVPPGDLDRSPYVTTSELGAAYAVLAWRTFIALSWPAVIRDGAPYPAPDTSRDLSYESGAYVPVWQAWPSAQDLFLPDGSHPDPFGTPPRVPSACSSLGARPGDRVLASVSKAGPFEAEFVQAFRMGPVPDQNGAYTWFAIQSNQAMYDYIVDNKLYNTDGQQAFASAADWPRGRRDSRGTVEDIGSIFVKAALKELGAGDDQSVFLRSPAWLYNPGTPPLSEPSCREATLGLAGLHIVHRTYSAPQWTWATFEHRRNVPYESDAVSGDLPYTSYNYFDPACVRNLCPYNALPVRPWDPDKGTRDPVQVVRMKALGPSAKLTNSYYWQSDASPVPGTVFTNYALIGVQFATVLGSPSPSGVYPIAPAYPNGEPAQRFLANTLIETFIQGFAPGARDPNFDFVPGLDQARSGGGIERGGSSCVGCHGDAAQTTGFDANYVYMLSRARPLSSVLQTRSSR